MTLKSFCKKVVAFTEEIFTPTFIAALFLASVIGGILGGIIGLLLVTAEWYSEHE